MATDAESNYIGRAELIQDKINKRAGEICSGLRYNKKSYLDII